MKPLRIGIIGLGTVGEGTAQLLMEQKAEIEAAAERPIEIVSAAVLHPDKERHVSLDGIRMLPDALAVADDPEVDVVVEAMGGVTEAKDAIERAIANGKHVVTANKALIATYGAELAQAAEEKGVTLSFEAAVAAELPVISGLHRYEPGEVKRVSGIINGSTNYILTRMTQEGMALEDAMAEAYTLGYLEADPSFDVDGIDAAQKLSILSALSFGVKPDVSTIKIEGIRGVTQEAIAQAKAQHQVIKLVASARIEDGKLIQEVKPTAVPEESALGRTNGAQNAITIDTEHSQESFTGRGAGGEATGKAIISDLVGIALGEKILPFHVPATSLLHTGHDGTVHSSVIHQAL